MISVIIIVKNDRRIERLLEALPKIEKPEKTEVIIVDASQGSLADIKKKFSYPRWITFENKLHKKTTIPDQRNVGINHAKGDIIAFIDSDCIPDKKWLVELIKPIRKEKENIVAGRVKLNEKGNVHNIAHEKLLGMKYVDTCPTMNVAIDKKVYGVIGRYDESFRFGSDVDFSWRAIKAGYKIRLNPKAEIYHDLGDAKNEIRRMYDYGKARTRLYMKHKNRIRIFLGNEFLTILFPISIILLPISLFFPYYPLVFLYPIFKHRDFKLILMKSIYGTGVLKELIIPDKK